MAVFPITETAMNISLASTLRRAAALVALVPALALANMGSNSDENANDPDFAEAKSAIEAKNWKSAEVAMRRALEKNPNNADAHNWLGFSLRKQERFDEAFASYDQALKLNPDHRSALEYLGEAYLQTKQPAKAEEQLARLVRLCTPIPCEEQKELARAIAAYKKANK